LDPAEVTKKDLFKACESLFGTDIDVSVEFLRYLKPDGVKAAYRKRALARAWNYISAVNAGARRGLQAALIGPYVRIVTIVYL